MGRGFGEGLSPGLIGASWPRDHKGPGPCVEAQLLMSTVWIRPFGYESWQRLWVLPPPPPPPPHALPPWAALTSLPIHPRAALRGQQRQGQRRLHSSTSPPAAPVFGRLHLNLAPAPLSRRTWDSSLDAPSLGSPARLLSLHSSTTTITCRLGDVASLRLNGKGE